MKRNCCFWRSLLPDRWFRGRRVVKTREMVSVGVMKVNFLYLHQRRQRMVALADRLGMGVDEMVAVMKKRLYEPSVGGKKHAGDKD